jgi:acyl-CoA reductase-like NAD-dependent aldehyde dehydrogenase
LSSGPCSIGSWKDSSQATRALTVGDPADPKTQLGPLVSTQQREKVEGFLATAKSREIIGGDRPAGRGAYLLPAIILGCETSDAVWQGGNFRTL